MNNRHYSILSKINTGWHLYKMSELANIKAGGTPSTFVEQFWVDGSIPWMNSGDLNKRFVFDVNGRITEQGQKNSSTFLVPKHSVLVGLAGQGKTRGTVAINEIDLCINQSIAAIMPKSIDVYYLFLFYNLDSRYGELRKISAGDGGRGGLNLSIIGNIDVLLPTFGEQKEIATILSTWDRAIERVQRLIEAKQRLKKGLMQGLLTGRIRFSEFGESIEELGNIPNGWKSVEFHDCATRSNKRIDPAMNDFNFRCVELEHISQESGKIIGETESKQQTSSKNYFRPGNVLFGKLRPYLHKFAYCDFEGVCSSEIWVLQNKSICTSRYLFYLIQTDTFLSASIQTTGTKMPRSDWSVVGKAKFFLPSLEEQERITALLDQVEINIELLERYVMQRKQQKKGLMQKLLTGEIRVKVE